VRGGACLHLHTQFHEKGYFLINDAPGQKVRVAKGQLLPRSLPRLEDADSVSLPQTVPGHGEAAEAAAAYGDALAPGRQYEQFPGLGIQAHAKTLQGADADGLSRLRTLAERLAGGITDAAQDVGQRHGPVQDIERLRRVIPRQVPDKGAGIDVQGTGGRTPGRLVLNAPLFPLAQFLLIHGKCVPGPGDRTA